MIDRLKSMALEWGRANRARLERINRRLARRLLGADEGFTVSGWSWKLHLEDKPNHHVAIDRLFFWFIKQVDHCRKAYDKDLLFRTANDLA
jgi:hypothetical protein